MEVRKSSPQLVTYSLYIVVPVLGFLNPQHPEPAKSKDLSMQSNHMFRINIEPSQATARKRWSPHSIPIRVWVRVQVEWS